MQHTHTHTHVHARSHSDPRLHAVLSPRLRTGSGVRNAGMGGAKSLVHPSAAPGRCWCRGGGEQGVPRGSHGVCSGSGSSTKPLLSEWPLQPCSIKPGERGGGALAAVPEEAPGGPEHLCGPPCVPPAPRRRAPPDLLLRTRREGGREQPVSSWASPSSSPALGTCTGGGCAKKGRAGDTCARARVQGRACV